MFENIDIVAIERKCKGETIRYIRKSNDEVIKQYYDLDMNLKRESIQNVFDKMLLRRRSRNTQDFMLNMIESFDYQEA